MKEEDASICLVLMNAYADWGGSGVLFAFAALLTLWMGQAWMTATVNYE